MASIRFPIRHRLCGLALALLAAQALQAAVASPLPGYTLTHLAPPAGTGTYSHGNRLAENGSVVGYTSSASYPVATTWLAGTPVGDSRRTGAVAGVPGSRHGVNAINAAGVMVGGYAGPYGSVAVAHTGSGWASLPWPDARYTCCGQVDDLNDAGVAVGSWYPLGRGAPVRWTLGAGGLWQAESLGGGQGGAVAINASGQIAGNLLVGGNTHAVLWQPDKTLLDLGPLDATRQHAQAADLNDAATVVGWGYNAAGRRQGFVWQAGAMTALPGLAGWEAAPGSSSWISSALAINDAGWVVGHALTASGLSHGFLMRPGEALVDLNSLVSTDDPFFDRSDVDPAGAGFTIVQADDINDQGQLLVTATYRHRATNGAITQATSAFLLTPTAPVPEPGTWLLWACGLALLGLRSATLSRQPWSLA